ncbi:MAG TPA: twin transmembrane helix small protein [Aestuariivirga sp.]|nr:twin transmembrane helix small protein [Alphaproteobacteria bacterium]HRX35465.1 twin transmembrane helix small protein [Aestuariivirga sp.]
MIIHYLGYIAVAAVIVVLLAGLWNMLRGGSPNTSQTLMRWRVILQFAAIIILMLSLWLTQR